MTTPNQPKSTCAHCGKEFVPKRKWQKFCGEKCRQANYWATHVVVPKPEPEKVP